jgi:hypothetical protein
MLVKLTPEGEKIRVAVYFLFCLCKYFFALVAAVVAVVAAAVAVVVNSPNFIYFNELSIFLQ